MSTDIVLHFVRPDAPQIVWDCIYQMEVPRLMMEKCVFSHWNEDTCEYDISDEDLKAAWELESQFIEQRCYGYQNNMWFYDLYHTRYSKYLERVFLFESSAWSNKDYRHRALYDALPLNQAAFILTNALAKKIKLAMNQPNRAPCGRANNSTAFGSRALIRGDVIEEGFYSSHWKRSQIHRHHWSREQRGLSQRQLAKFLDSHIGWTFFLTSE